MKAAEIRELTVAEIEERIDAEKKQPAPNEAQPLQFSPVENPTYDQKKRVEIYRPHDDDSPRKRKT